MVRYLTKEKVWYSPADLHPFFQWIDPIVCGWRSKMKAATAELNWTFTNDQECDDVCGSLLSVLQASLIPQLPPPLLIKLYMKEGQLFW